MRWLVNWSLNNRLAVIVGWIAITLFGIRSLTVLGIDAVPDLTNVQVQIITESPGYAPEEVERQVTVPVELSMGGLEGLELVRSITRSGLSVVTAVFVEGTDIYRARQLVSERLSEAKEGIPKSFGSPGLAPVSTGLGEIYQFEVRAAADFDGPKPDAMALRETLEWVISPRLRTIEGVAEVNAFGGELKTYQVTLDPVRMAARRIQIADLVEALSDTNRNVGGGIIESNEESLIVRGEALLTGAEDISSVVVRHTDDGGLVTIADVAVVELAPMLRYGAVTRDGKGEATTGIVMMLLGANARQVSSAADAAIRDIDATLPEIEIDTFYDRSHLVDRSIGTVAENLLVGGGLVVLILLLLIGNLRAGLLVALAVPLSFLCAVIGMEKASITGNLMSLGALDFGIIIDGSVVMVEHIVRRLAEARPDKSQRLAVVRASALEVARPTGFAVLVIAIVYVPILSLRGIEGKMFGPMAWTVIFALAGALLCALTLTPVLSSLVFGHVKEKKPVLFRAAERVHGKVLPTLMRHPVAVSLAALALVASSGWLSTQLGAVFLPQLDEGDLALQIARQPAVGLEESLEQASTVETLIRDNFSEVRAVVSRTGRAEIATDPMGIDFSDVLVLLHPREAWTTGRDKAGIEEGIKELLEHSMPGVGISLTQPIELRVNELLEGVRSDVGISVFGDDLDLLAEKANDIAAAVGTVEGAGDVEAGKTAGLPQLRIRIDRGALVRHGLDAEEVLETIALVGGRAVGALYEHERRFELRLRVAEKWRTDPHRVAEIPITSSAGHAVRLGEVATVERVYGPASISRENGRRRAIIEANVRGRDLVGFVTDAKMAAQKVELPAGWYLEWGGQFKNLATATKHLSFTVPVALLMILVLLTTALGSGTRALFVYLAVPMAACGGIFALWLRAYPLSISAAIGFIALSGVAVMNGVVLMSTIIDLEKTGMSPGAAASKASGLRLRAVLMTALTDVFGFLPMALSTSEGAEVQRPLATVVVGGIVTATILTLVVLPSVYAWLSGVGGTAEAAKAGEADDLDGPDAQWPGDETANSAV